MSPTFHKELQGKRMLSRYKLVLSKQKWLVPWNTQSLKVDNDKDEVAYPHNKNLVAQYMKIGHLTTNSRVQIILIVVLKYLTNEKLSRIAR